VNLAKQVLEKARDQTEAVRGREVAQHRVRLACRIARPVCAAETRFVNRPQAVGAGARHWPARGSTARLPALAGDMQRTTDDGDDSSFDRLRPLRQCRSRERCAQVDEKALGREWSRDLSQTVRML
jgi:hypothetical protein